MASKNHPRQRIKEAIIVEGRDDVAAVGSAVDALIIPTHGFGISKETWELIEKAYKEKGIIVLTDPDHAGEEIRKRIKAKFPEAKDAYIPKKLATRANDIGVENAAEDSIIEAILNAHATRQNDSQESIEYNAVTDFDMERLGLKGSAQATVYREKVAARLGIGYGNAKAMRKMINGYEISLAELERAVEWARTE